MFIENEWYVASWAKDLGRTPLARKICNQPIVLYRREDGSAVAMEDVCPHRLLPLSMGFIEGDDIRCRYHGLLLGPDGYCLSMPGGAGPNKGVKAREYPVFERYGLIWTWIGDPALADRERLPDLWMNEAPGWRFGGGEFSVACDYRLIIDNLMDLTHETYVHSSSIGQKELHDFPIETEVSERGVTTSRWMPGVKPPPAYKKALGDYNGLVDRWQISYFLPPHGVIIDVGVATLDRKVTLENHDSAQLRSFVLDFATPSTETTSYYFWGNAAAPQNFPNDKVFEKVIETQRNVFLEDVEVLEAQQRQIDGLPNRKLAAYPTDSGGVKARLMLNKMLAASKEQQMPNSKSDAVT